MKPSFQNSTPYEKKCVIRYVNAKLLKTISKIGDSRKSLSCILQMIDFVMKP